MAEIVARIILTISVIFTALNFYRYIQTTQYKYPIDPAQRMTNRE